jgi:anti-sigma B factor antagonist
MEPMESGLGIDAQNVDGVAGACRIVLKGPLDAKSVVHFKEAIHRLQQKGQKRFILDMSDVKFVNSTGLSYLINLAESLGEGLQAVTLVGVQPKVKIVFDTMSVGDFFRTAPTIAAAIQMLRKEPAPKPAMTAAASAKATEGKPARPKAAPALKREHSSTKTGRVAPPTHHEKPPGLFVRVWRKLFGR